MKRKWLSVFLAIVLIVSCLPLSAGAAEIVDSGTCGAEGNEANVTWSLSDEGVLTISGTGAMEDYGKYFNDNAPWYSYREKIKTVNIDEGVTEIGEEAFSGCTALPGITFPASLTRIGGLAFQKCSSLKRITIPGGVTQVGTDAFAWCSGLTEILVAENNANYTDQDGIVFSKDKTELHSYPGGKKGPYEIPANVTQLRPYSFLGCSGLTSVTFLNDRTEISSDVFKDCTALTSIALPANLTGHLANYLFQGCSSLKSITIPSGVTRIGDSAFYGCTSLTTVTLPAGLTYIDFLAFTGCSSLKNINLPDSLTTIGCNAFERCTSLTSITLPAGLDSISSFMFRDCTSLTSVTLPAGLTYIGTQVFMGCTSLKSISIPSGVRDIGNAFTGCSSLTSVIIPEGATRIHSSAFQDCSSLKNIVIPSSVTNIESAAFQCCSSLTSVVIPESVTSIECQAFASCSSLKKAVFRGNAPATFDDPTDLRIFGFTHKDFCIYYQDGASGWTTPTWNGYPCKPVSQMPPDTPDPPVNPDPPIGGGDIPPEPGEPTVETVTTESGNTATVTTQPDGGKEIEVKTPSGETAAQVKLPADPGVGKKFEDVKGWYEGAVDKATAYGLFDGTSETKFSPDSSMTRGMLAKVLYNLSGDPRYGVGDGTFADVQKGAWYGNASDWAAKAGVVNGTSKTEFSPNRNITRQELVTMLYRYAKFIGADSKSSAGLEKFGDAQKVSGYAKEAMQWAVAEGFIQGRGNLIAPQGTATRAEVAAVLTRFVEFLK